MTDRLPIPTDNIYKFYALFGMVVLLTSAIMFFVRHEHYRSTSFDNYMQIADLENKEEISARDKLEIESLVKMRETLKKDKDFELEVYTYAFSMGMFLSIVGFYFWHTKVQPRQDALIDLEIKRLRNELKADSDENVP